LRDVKKRISLILVVFLCLGCLSSAAAGTDFTDVPGDSWAGAYIRQAVSLGIINGYGNQRFGYGDNVSRAQFSAMLVRLFGWEPARPAVASFSDNDPSQWYFSDVETAVAHGAVLTDSPVFRPNDSITRMEMAVMLVRALGYDTLAKSQADRSLPFKDVTEETGYIAIARDFGIITGVSETSFRPNDSATREQAAAMMIRLYNLVHAKTDFLHGFYAISSYSQRDLIPSLDAVSFGWSRLQYTASGEVLLNQTSAGGNPFSLPTGYAEVTKIAREAGTAANLSVFMDTAQTVTMADGRVSNACREILLEPKNRTEAIRQIKTALTGEIPYGGVTIDFEGMKGEALKAGLNAFLKELRESLYGSGLSLFVCVPPATADGYYFDAYDFRTIGEYADRVILMAHDYEASTLTSSLMAAGFTATPLTPISSVYYALKAVTDPETGVKDTGKVALALSFGSVQWMLSGGAVQNAAAFTPTPQAIYNRLLNPETVLHYSERYQNPYLTYSSGGMDSIVWYEDERSVEAKLRLARMFGITGVSVWRLGLIPDYDSPADREIYYNVSDVLLKR